MIAHAPIYDRARRLILIKIDGEGEGCRVAEIRGEPNALLILRL